MKALPFFSLLGRIYRPFGSVAGRMFVLLMAAQLIYLSLPYLQGKLIDNLATHGSLETSLWLSALVLGVYVVGVGMAYCKDVYELHRWDFAFTRHIEVGTLEKLFKFSLGQHVNENSGLRMSVATKGRAALVQIADSFVYQITPNVLQIVLTSVALLFISWKLGIIVALFGSAYLAAIFRLNIRFYPLLKANRHEWNKNDKHQKQLYQNAKLVKFSAKEDEAVRNYAARYDALAGPSRDMWIGFIGTSYPRHMFLRFGQVSMLMVGVLLVHAGVESPGVIVMLLGWSGTIFNDISQLGYQQRNLLQNIADASKYDEMLSREPAIKDSPTARFVDWIEGRIEFKDVSFAYPKLKSVEDDQKDEDEEEEEDEEASKEVLQNVSFSIEPGQTVAIVGRSGAGKSTIVTLLQRGYDPDGGAILVDGTDLRQLQQVSYRRHVGFVPQQIELFDSTIRYNLEFESGPVSDERLEEVAKAARIDQFYDRLNRGFDTLVGENGIKLSGGERQRVGIARALLKNPDMFIFDEATSNLDAENEALIHEAMREALEGKTGIIIAHRLSTVRDADKIIVLHKGMVAAIGKHDELMDSCPEYRKLVQRQMVMV